MCVGTKLGTERLAVIILFITQFNPSADLKLSAPNILWIIIYAIFILHNQIFFAKIVA